MKGCLQLLKIKAGKKEETLEDEINVNETTPPPSPPPTTITETILQFSLNVAKLRAFIQADLVAVIMLEACLDNSLLHHENCSLHEDVHH